MSDENIVANSKEELDAKRARIAAKEKEIESTLEQSEESVQATRRELTSLKGELDSASRAFNSAYDRLDYATWIVAILAGIIYYGIYFSQGLPLNWPLLAGLAIPLGTFLALRIIFLVVKVQLSTVRESNLESALTKVGTFAKRLTTAARSYVPYVNEYYEGKERIQKQEAFVISLRNALAEYGFALTPKVRSYLDSFSSLSDDRDEWLESTSAKLSSSYKEPQVIFKLAFADYESEDGDRKNEWNAICKNQPTLQQFVTLLVTRNLVDISTVYLEQSKLAVDFVANRLGASNDFTLKNARTTIARAFQLIEKEKEDFRRALYANNVVLPESDREEFSRLLPIRDAHSEFLDWLAKHTKVRSYIVELFFLDFRAASETDDHFFELKKDEAKIAELSKELLNRKIVSVMGLDERQRKDEDVYNLAVYLGQATRYDKAEVASTFSRYSRLYQYSKDTLNFLKNEGICKNEAELGFKRILSQDFGSPDFLGQLIATVQLSLREFASYSEIGFDWVEPITLAAMTIHLERSEDTILSYPTKRRAASVTRAVLILYEWSWTNADEQEKIAADKTNLGGIIRHTIDGKRHSDVYYTEFHRALTAGFLFNLIKDIPNTIFRGADQLVNSLSDVRAKLDKHVGALGRFLETELDNETIMESLKMQLVAAYAITVPTSGGRIDVLSSIIERLPEMCKDLEAGDSIYSGLFLPKEAEDTSFGSHTRIGIVPFRMDFKDFTGLFENAYRKTVRKRDESNLLSYAAEKYVANITRIFPTSAYFKQLAVESKKGGGEDHLTNILKSRMIEKFGPVRTVEILASLKKTSEGKMAMRSMLSNLYDEHSRIYFIDRDRFDGLFSGSQSKLVEYLKDGGLDKDLLDRFDRQTLSDLAVMIHRSGPAVQTNMRKHIGDICHAIRAELTDEAIEELSSIIFDALNDVGMILDRLTVRESQSDCRLQV